MIQGYTVARILRALIMLIGISIAGIGVITTVFTPAETEYILLDTIVTTDNTTASLYRLTYDPDTQKIMLKHVYDINTTIQIIQQNTTIDLGDAIAPHLYDAYVAPHENPGANYVYLGVVEPYNGSYTMIMRVEAYPTDDHVVNLFTSAPGYKGYFAIDIKSDGYRSSCARDPFTYELYRHPWASSRDIEFALMYNYDTNETYYIDVDEVTVDMTTRHGWGYRIRLGADHDWDTPPDQDREQDPTRWSYFIFYSKLLPASDVQRLLESKIVNDVGFLKFFDATWFNGTHYISLTGEAYSIVGSVTRIPAYQTWLWHVVKEYNDGLVHFMWFPVNSTIRLRDPVNYTVLYEFNITGTAVGSTDQVYDYAVSIEPRTYIVEALIRNRPGATIVDLPPYAVVRVNGTELIVPEEGFITIPPGTYHVQIVAKNVVYKTGDIPFIYDPATDKLVFNTGCLCSVFIYSYDPESRSFTLVASRSGVDNIYVYAEGNIVYPVIVRYVNGNAEVIRNTYFIVLENTTFYLPLQDVYITFNKTVTCRSIRSTDTELVVDGKSISIENANVSITRWLSNEIELVADVPSGTTSYIYIRGIEWPSKVVVKHPGSVREFKMFLTGDMTYFYQWNGDAVFYDSGQKLLAIKIVHHSPATISIVGEDLLGATADMIYTLVNALTNILAIAIPLMVVIAIVSMLLRSVKKIV